MILQHFWKAYEWWSIFLSIPFNSSCIDNVNPHSRMIFMDFPWFFPWIFPWKKYTWGFRNICPFVEPPPKLRVNSCPESTLKKRQKEAQSEVVCYSLYPPEIILNEVKLLDQFACFKWWFLSRLGKGRRWQKSRSISDDLDLSMFQSRVRALPYLQSRWRS